MAKGSRTSKVIDAWNKAGGNKDPEAAAKAAHRVGEREELAPHGIRALISRLRNPDRKKAAAKRPAKKAVKRPARQVKKARPVRVARVAKKAAD